MKSKDDQDAPSREPPDLWVWPQLPFGGSSSSSLQWRTSLKSQPFPLHPPPPPLLPRTPLALFVMLRDRAARAGVGEGCWSAQGGWRGRCLQAALGARPASGGTRPKERAKASCGETVVQKGVCGEPVFFSAPPLKVCS